MTQEGQPDAAEVQTPALVKRVDTTIVNIAGYPNFEHLEAGGQRLLREQLKAMLKALGQKR